MVLALPSRTSRQTFTGCIHGGRRQLQSPSSPIHVVQVAVRRARFDEDQESKGGGRTSTWMHSEQTKKRMSDAKVRSWADSNFRQKVTQADVANPCPENQGGIAWNRGQKASEATRVKMSVAKRGRKHSRATVVRMSEAASGRSHQASTICKIAASKRGTALSATHREAISTAQKKRHAARRVLSAVEAVHKTLSTADYRSLKLSSTLTRAQKQSRYTGTGTLEEVQSDYIMQLREFRSLQAELGPWMAAFKSRHSRLPVYKDAVATEIEWISYKFEQYTNLKEALMVEIPSMRPTMAAATRRSKPMNVKQRLLLSRSQNMNANRSATGSVDAASRMQAAQDYKRVQANADTAKDAASDAASDSHVDQESSTCGTQDAVKDVAGGGSAAAVRMQAALSKARSYKAGESGGVGKTPDRKVAASVSDAGSARVKAALFKAMQYKSSGGPDGQAPVRKKSAILMKPVVGKTINGIDYGSSDASNAPPGESPFVQAGSMPVVSNRRRTSVEADPVSTSAPRAVDAVQSSADNEPAGVSQQPAVTTQEAADVSEHDDSWDQHTGSANCVNSLPMGGWVEGRTEAVPVTTAMLKTMMLDLRRKQAAATAAVAHAAAIAAVQLPAATATDGHEMKATVHDARAAARYAQQDFEDARLRVKDLLSERSCGCLGDVVMS